MKMNAQLQKDDEDAAAAIPLSLEERTDPGAGEAQGDHTIPVGDTLMGIVLPAPRALSENEKTDERKRDGSGSGDTSTAARAILEKYVRRPRT